MSGYAARLARADDCQITPRFRVGASLAAFIYVCFNTQGKIMRAHNTPS